MLFCLQSFIAFLLLRHLTDVCVNLTMLRFLARCYSQLQLWRLLWGLEIAAELNMEITVRLDVLTVKNVEISCKIRDTAATVEIAVGFGDCNGIEYGDYCEIGFLTAKNVEISCKIRDTAATVEIAVGFGDSNGSECGDCEISCSNRKECGDSLQDTRHNCDCGDCCGFWRF